MTQRTARLFRLADLAGRSLARLPGLLAFGCAVAGTFLLANLGAALLVAAGMLLLLDRRMP